MIQWSSLSLYTRAIIQESDVSAIAFVAYFSAILCNDTTATIS